MVRDRGGLHRRLHGRVPAAHPREPGGRAAQGWPPRLLQEWRQHHRFCAPRRAHASSTTKAHSLRAGRRGLGSEPGCTRLHIPSCAEPCRGDAAARKPCPTWAAWQVAIVPWYISRVGGDAPGFLSLLRIIRAPASPTRRPTQPQAPHLPPQPLSQPATGGSGRHLCGEPSDAAAGLGLSCRAGRCARPTFAWCAAAQESRASLASSR